MKMDEPGAILLVSCYELGHQPLNLASPLAHLRRAGYAPVTVDTAVEALPDDAVARAQLVAISVPMHTALRLGVLVGKRVRALNPSAHLVFFGLYASLNFDHLLGTCADSVIGGEYEGPLLALVRSLASGGGADGIAGVQTRTHPAPPALARIAPVLPGRPGLPTLDRYAQLCRGDEVALAGYVEATRGCLHTCLHCPITPVYGGRLVAMPRDVVLADIRQQVEAGARHITFGDPDFLNGPTHSLRIVRAMHAEFPDVTFDATIKIEHILERRDIFPELAALGCVFVVSAVESLSDDVLAHLRKGHTRADVVEALDILARAGIPLRLSLVSFTPWTTLDDYLDVLDFVGEHDLIEQVDPVQYTIRLLVPPGSALLEQPDTQMWLGPLDEDHFTYLWDHPDPHMDALYRHVSQLVEEAQRAGCSHAQIFAAVRARALEIAGRLERSPVMVGTGAGASAGGRQQRVVPHLTEAWFC